MECREIKFKMRMEIQEAKLEIRQRNKKNSIIEIQVLGDKLKENVEEFLVKELQCICEKGEAQLNRSGILNQKLENESQK